MNSSPLAPTAAPSSLPRPWVSLTLLLALSIATASLMAPLARAAWANQPPEIATTVRTALWAVGLAAPVFALLKTAVLAALAWALLVLGGRQPGYRSLLTPLLAGELILSVQGLWIAGVLYLRGVDSLASPGDLTVTTGLDLLFPDPATVAGAAALSVTPFHLAWIGFLAWAFTRATGGRRWLGGLTAVACWVPAPLLAALRAWSG